MMNTMKKVFMSAAALMMAVSMAGCGNSGSGNSGMATGGSGDVLTGVIASLAAQGLSAERAAVLGVWLHGAAGDEAAKEKSPYSMIARDLADGLSKVLIQISRKKV